jgi:hypothetical protein
MSIEFIRIKNDINGNPRVVCHFLDLFSEEEKAKWRELHGLNYLGLMYKWATKRANKIGGRKYDTKAYGGGIVFQTYSLDELTKAIERVIEEDK